ncbi:hypothetical protein C0992_001939 [Termitomyces sp. T32_za158]|nr:hypothetical protein C0992_001939 [Termitomyces sp. T32_za158]
MFATVAKHQKTEMYKLVSAMTPLRKDIWPSREAAVKWMQVRPPWSSWDQRVFDIYTVCLLHCSQKLPRMHLHLEIRPAVPTDSILSRQKRSNIDNAQKCDREVQDSIVDPKEGRNFASITRIKGVGHLVRTLPESCSILSEFTDGPQVVQEVPTKLAKAILAILRKTPQLDAVSRL